MSGKMIGIDNIIENEVYIILIFISIEFIREEKSQRSIAKENAMVCVSFISKRCSLRHLQHTQHRSAWPAVKALGSGRGEHELTA